MTVFLRPAIGPLPWALGVGFVISLVYSITSGIYLGFSALNVWGMVPTTLFFAATTWVMFILRWFPWGWLFGHTAKWFGVVIWAVPGFYVLMSLCDFAKLALSKQLPAKVRHNAPQAKYQPPTQ